MPLEASRGVATSIYLGYISFKWLVLRLGTKYLQKLGHRILCLNFIGYKFFVKGTVPKLKLQTLGELMLEHYLLTAASPLESCRRN